VGQNNTVNPQKHYIPVPSSSKHNGTNDVDSSGQAEKRRKLFTTTVPTQAQAASIKTQVPAAWRDVNGVQQANYGSASCQEIGHVMHTQSGPTPNRIVNQSMATNKMNKSHSVQYINAALKTNGATASLIEEMAVDGPRPLEIGRVDTHSGPTTSSLVVTTPTTASTIPIDPVSPVYSSAQGTNKMHITNGSYTEPMRASQPTSQTASRDRSAVQVMEKDVSLHMVQPLRNSFFSGAAFVPEDEDKDSVLSDASLSTNQADSCISTQAATNTQYPAAASSPQPVSQNLLQSKRTGPFSEEEEHLLIFLKEVKRLPWKQITPEFNQDFPGRAYSTLQSRYTTKTNKRDRSQDPSILKLPPRWAAEATIDWASVHSETHVPRERVEVGNLRRDGMAIGAASRPSVIRQTTENDYSSGTDSGIRQSRPRRVPPVNYDVRRRNKRLDSEVVDLDTDNMFATNPTDIDTPIQSETSFGGQVTVPAKAHMVANEPLEVQFDADDASIALIARKRWHGSLSQKLPYLDASQRLILQNVPEGWGWDQLSSRNWQGSLLHVDFSPRELAQVERAMADIWKTPKESRHSTQRRRLRTVLRSLTEPKLLQLAHTIQRFLPTRDSISITAFLRDARMGSIADAPQILRLAAARPSKHTRTVLFDSTTALVRQRELGVQSRRGWRTASRPLTYLIRNKLMDTLGPLCSWTGASSDIHTVAWSPDGENFAAGAVAVTDQDSMQYNRPNNFLYGNLSDVTIHELAEHSIERQRTESGANSSYAMFVSQDPKLYTTVTSVAFAPSGKVMYSAGYDKSVCVWDLDSTSLQPSLAAKLRHKAEVELMVVNRNYAGVLATAARRISGNAVKLITLNEDDPSDFATHNFQSAKATSRSDLRILPQALQFEPRFGTMLLAGFGANVKEDNGFDTIGDLCLWDITTQAQFSIHGSNGNVFDIAFNPNRRHMPLFAAGCVAGGNVNRGTRSVIRMYEERAPDKYTRLLEIECRALDMNDVVWCPQDEHLIAAGCTDGCVYIWDMRNSDEPVHVLSHENSLMPLQDGVHHERTDTGVRFLSWGENTTRLYSGSSDGIVKVWDVTRPDEDTFVKDLITVDSGIMAGAFTPDYSKLILGEVDGSVTVLDVGRDDYTIKDTDKLRYVGYEGEEVCDYDSLAGGTVGSAAVDSGVAEGKSLIQSRQLQLAPMGNLPVRQVVQGPDYVGPFDQGVDAPFLREQALNFQLSMASTCGPQCNIATCTDNMIMMTSEESGDSRRSKDRIPDELRLQWTTIGMVGIVPGKSRCTHCGRPARLSSSNDDPEGSVLCERCAFACFRCGAVNPIAATTTTLNCDSCAGVWEIGALGYECVQQPATKNLKLDIPSLRQFGRDMLEERWAEELTNYGDEMNALTDYYHSLAIDRPESPPL
jgi:WD40 repeat protein